MLAQVAQRGGSPIHGNFHGLDEALSDLIQLEMSLLMAGAWTRWALEVPPNPFCDSMCIIHPMVPQVLLQHSPLPPITPQIPLEHCELMVTPGISLLCVT